MKFLIETLAVLFAFLMLFVPRPVAAEVNDDLRIHLMVDQSLPAPEALLKRLATGQNVQAIIECRTQQGAEPRLIDPLAVEVTYAGEPVESFVYMRGPQAALVFALLDAAQLAANPKAEFSMAARFIGSAEPDAGWVLPVEFTDEQVAAVREAQLPNRGRPVQVTSGGGPVAGAYLFGQRREDLFTRSRDDGAFMLTAPTRNAAGPHYAWSAQHWTTPFDPVSSRTIELLPFIPGDPENHRIDIELVDHEGTPVEQAVVVVADRYYLTYRGAPVTIEVPGNITQIHILVIRAAMLPERIELQVPGPARRTLQLASREQLAARLQNSMPTTPAPRSNVDGGG